MIWPIVMVVLLGACFFALVLNLAADSRIRKTVMRFAILVAAGVGIVYYGYGYVWCNGLSAESLFRALLAMCRMLAGINDYGSIQSCPLLHSSFGRAVFWLGHFCGFYVTASAAITTLGEQLLRKIRTKLLRRGPLLLIYGVNDASVSYGKDMMEKKKRAVLFVDPDGDTGFENTIKQAGAVLESSADALNPDRQFLRNINFAPGNRSLELAAMHADGRKNLKYASDLLDVMEEAGIRPEQASLIIAGAGSRAAGLQASEGSGYGRVFAYDDYELTARLVIRDYPPCERIRFDGHGKAVEDFRAVILGYGRMGRAMLAQLICNAQFTGSTFHADVFDPGPQNGFLHGQTLAENYDIRFHPENGKTDEFYRFLEENSEQIRCIVLCTGSADENREIAEDLTGWYGFGRRLPMIIQASKGCYYGIDENGCASECTNIYRSDVLDLDRMDAMAMQINHIYAGSGKDAEENWKDCDYFSRMSSRASADFFPAMLRAAGKTADEVLAGDWPPDAETLENLAVTEHLRWCAFQHVMGFETMPEEVYARRLEAYRTEKEKTGTGSGSIGKDMKNRLHACLIPWEELDALSARENAVTGGCVDYKQMDRNNVLVLAKVLAAMKETEKKG